MKFLYIPGNSIGHGSAQASHWIKSRWHASWRQFTWLFTMDFHIDGNVQWHHPVIRSPLSVIKNKFYPEIYFRFKLLYLPGIISIITPIQLVYILKTPYVYKWALGFFRSIPPDSTWPTFYPLYGRQIFSIISNGIPECIHIRGNRIS